MISLFITGTDTDVGKTYISLGLLKCFRHHGLQTVALKPVASGCQRHGTTLVNTDALALQHEATIALPYDAINPFALKAPIAPHIAAKQQHIHLNKQDIALSISHFMDDAQTDRYPSRAKLQTNSCRDASCGRQARASTRPAPTLKHAPDILLVEGAGGWHLPLNEQDAMSEVVIALQLNIILVVGMKLGCLNHALLTRDAMLQAGARLVGWVANEIQPGMLALHENKASLDNWLQVPCLGFIPFKAKAEEHLDIVPLL